MKYLNGKDLAEFIKERQLKQVRNLRQGHHIYPKLAIVHTIDNPVLELYMKLKKSYGEDILIDVDTYKVSKYDIEAKILSLNTDKTIQGIIVQLPLDGSLSLDHVLSLISPEKDVDGLGDNAKFDSATPTAINWLLGGYNVELKDKQIAIVGNGRLVGKPLSKIWRNSGYNVRILDKQDDISIELKKANVIVSAVGSPGVISSAMIQPSAVVVDAGSTNEDGQVKGDIADDVYIRDDLTITPKKGGVGPLTVSALFDNVIRAARNQIK